MTGACIFTSRTCDIEGSSIETEDPTIEIKEHFYTVFSLLYCGHLRRVGLFGVVQCS